MYFGSSSGRAGKGALAPFPPATPASPFVSAFVLALTDRDGAWAVEWFTSPRQYSPVLRLDSEPAAKPGATTLSGDDTQARWFDGGATHAFRTDTGQHTWTNNNY